MRKIKIMGHISLDGIIQPTGSGRGDDYENGEWMVPYRSPAGLEAVLEAQGMSFDLLLGRRTYDLWAGHWPKAGSSPVADGINAATKYVATHRPESLGWGPVSPLGTDIIAGVRDIRSKDGPDLVAWGSTTLTYMLLGQGLVDEVVMIVYPVLLGQGKRFFPDSTAPHKLTLVSSKAAPTGALINTYRCVGATGS